MNPLLILYSPEKKEEKYFLVVLVEIFYDGQILFLHLPLTKPDKEQMIVEPSTGVKCLWNRALVSNDCGTENWCQMIVEPSTGVK